MKAFLDTSVLVSAFYGDHPRHAASLVLLSDMEPRTGCCGAHSLVEVYSAATRMPGKHRVSGEQAILFLESVRERLHVVALDATECAEELTRWSRLRVAGGTIYDAMLASCAIKAKAETIYTWNIRHYAQCGGGVSEIVRTP